MNLDWDNLRIFLAISNAGTLSGAAKLLNVSQPTVGRRIKVLEKDLKQTLFQRTDEGFILTAEGHILLKYVRRIENELYSLQRKLTLSDNLEGILRISTTEWFGVHVLTPIIAKFSQKYPAITIELLNETHLVSLTHGEADLGFRFQPFNEPDVIQKKFLHVSFKLYASKRYLQKHPFDINLAGKDHTLVTMNTAYDMLADVQWLKRYLPMAHLAVRTNSRDAQAKLSEYNAGLTVLPCMIGDNNSNLVAIDLEQDLPHRIIWLGYHRDFKHSLLLTTFLEFANIEFANTLGLLVKI